MRHAYVASLALCFFANHSRADFVIGLYNTGELSSGSLGAYSTQDPYWTLINSADPNVNSPTPAYIANGNSYPFVPGGWLPDGPNSEWIDPLPNQSTGDPPGYYTYQTTFTITGNPGNVLISGLWTADNVAANLIVNGVSTGAYYDAPGDYTFKAFAPFTVPTSDLAEGTNTLDFVVYNTDNGNGSTPTGLRVEFNVQYATPEPASITLMGLGMAGLTVYGWRWRRV